MYCVTVNTYGDGDPTQNIIKHTYHVTENVFHELASSELVQDHQQRLVIQATEQGSISRTASSSTLTSTLSSITSAFNSLWSTTPVHDDINQFVCVSSHHDVDIDTAHDSALGVDSEAGRTAVLDLTCVDSGKLIASKLAWSTLLAEQETDEFCWKVIMQMSQAQHSNWTDMGLTEQCRTVTGKVREVESLMRLRPDRYKDTMRVMLFNTATIGCVPIRVVATLVCAIDAHSKCPNKYDVDVDELLYVYRHSTPQIIDMYTALLELSPVNADLHHNAFWRQLHISRSRNAIADRTEAVARATTSFFAGILPCPQLDVIQFDQANWLYDNQDRRGHLFATIPSLLSIVQMGTLSMELVLLRVSGTEAASRCQLLLRYFCAKFQEQVVVITNQEGVIVWPLLPNSHPIKVTTTNCTTATEFLMTVPLSGDQVVFDGTRYWCTPAYRYTQLTQTLLINPGVEPDWDRVHTLLSKGYRWYQPLSSLLAKRYEQWINDTQPKLMTWNALMNDASMRTMLRGAAASDHCDRVSDSVITFFQHMFLTSTVFRTIEVSKLELCLSSLPHQECAIVEPQTARRGKQLFVTSTQRSRLSTRVHHVQCNQEPNTLFFVVDKAVAIKISVNGLHKMLHQVHVQEVAGTDQDMVSLTRGVSITTDKRPAKEFYDLSKHSSSQISQFSTSVWDQWTLLFERVGKALQSAYQSTTQPFCNMGHLATPFLDQLFKFDLGRKHDEVSVYDLTNDVQYMLFAYGSNIPVQVDIFEMLLQQDVGRYDCKMGFKVSTVELKMELCWVQLFDNQA